MIFVKFFVPEMRTKVYFAAKDWQTLFRNTKDGKEFGGKQLEDRQEVDREEAFLFLQNDEAKAALERAEFCLLGYNSRQTR